MPYARNGDVRLHYESFGSGEPLVLIMGLGGTIAAWGLQIPAFAQHYRVLAADNRGAGRSDQPDAPYEMALFAADLEAVLDAAEVERAHLIGVSMGGMIAQEFYHRQPERVRSLTLACTGVGPNDPAFVPAPPEVGRALDLDREQESPEHVMEAMAEVFYHPQYRARIPDLVDRLVKINQAQPQPPHGYRRQLEAIRGHRPYSPRLPEIEVPTLVLHGEDDLVWPLANADVLAAGIPRARRVVIPASGHMFMIEKPRQFNKAVLEFLDAVAHGRA